MQVPSWSDICRYASEAGAKYPELVAAQFALESNWGRTVSGQYNYFGIKGTGTKKETSEFINGVEKRIIDEFQDFESPQACVKYLVEKWYKDYKSYKGVNNAANRDEAAKMLYTEKYATDPNYSTKLINIMNSNTAPRVSSTLVEKTIPLSRAAFYYSGKEHQDEAWKFIEGCLSEGQKETFAKMYRSNAQTVEQKFPLKIPYFYQRDSKTGHGERSCQSSAIAMVLEYLNPNLIGDDDSYLNLVFRYGDTVSQSAHQKALDHLGVKYQFKNNGTLDDLRKLLDQGIPVPIGVLHKGTIFAPTGGGHWITLIGYDSKYFDVHDPFGEMDLINGGYPKNGPTDGKYQRYSIANLAKRWLIANNHDGWYWSFAGNQFKKQ